MADDPLHIFSPDGATAVTRNGRRFVNGHPVRGMTMAQRLEHGSMPEPMSGCQLWLGFVNPGGYAITYWKRRPILAHRIAWQIANGRKVPDGLMVCHRCDVRSCINPNHLWLGTGFDNMRDCSRKGRLKKRRMQRGAANAQAKLTEDDVRRIRDDTRAQARIAVDYDVSQSIIHLIKSGARWSHVR